MGKSGKKSCEKEEGKEVNFCGSSNWKKLASGETVFAAAKANLTELDRVAPGTENRAKRITNAEKLIREAI